MEANELRMNNLVSVNETYRDKGDLLTLNQKNFEILIVNQTYRRIFPIPLTEEWLLKFGFTLMPESEYTLNTYEFDEFQLWNKNGDFSEMKYLTNRESIVVKSVHQLQNLYFALKGEELTIKD